ncbi:hypothetical protein KFL_001780030 [Klebsormidium nitens]|uniref:Nucleoside phosphorylase domain-containing protein n=1 Tax=Klebsormidium nitens TaxID=105231 RepID=A0A1Y1I7R2_KLENI|nr:hypothetical protein KFL_001780030 [Klebsormidium nitens]|eukprot:GAQ84148.1 hypothetical protein KFL_001780030 [Klebsormidium nitens]
MSPNSESSVEDKGIVEDRSQHRAIKTVAVLFAMQAESTPLIEHLKLTVNSDHLFPKGSPWIVYSGGHGDVHFHVIVPGKDGETGVDNVGTVPAAVATYAAIDKLKPDLLINAGTSGGFKAKGAAIGDVYFISTFVNHDRRIPLPGFEKYGIGAKQATQAPNLVKALGLKEGILSTANSFDLSEKDREWITKNDATVKDMEGSGFAWVAATLGVPFLGIKAITDLVDGGRPTQEEFLENLHTAAAALKRVVPEVVSFASGKRLNEL